MICAARATSPFGESCSMCARGADRDRRGGANAARMAAHAVADRHQGARRRTTSPGCSTARCRRRRRSSNTCTTWVLRKRPSVLNHLSSNVVAPMRTGTRGARIVGALMRCWLTTVPLVLCRSSMAHESVVGSG